MNKKIIVCLIGLIGCSVASALDNNYQPLVREGVVWHYANEYWDRDEDGFPIDSTCRIIYGRKMEFSGDTVISGVQYKKCFRYYNDWLDDGQEPYVYGREKNGRVSFMNPTFEGYVPEFALRGEYYNLTGEYDVYDFEDMGSFLSQTTERLGPVEIVSVTTVQVGGNPAKCYRIHMNSTFTCWAKYIEGVGVDNDSFGLSTCSIELPILVGILGTPSALGLVMLTDKSGEVLYKGAYYNEDYARGYRTTMRSDMNGDHKVDIGDVNIAINAMLGKSADAADVNGDGACDIADVNAVINAMLGKQ